MCRKEGVDTLHWCFNAEDIWPLAIWKPAGEKRYYLVDDDMGSLLPENDDWKVLDGPWATLSEARVRYMVRAATEGWGIP